MSAITRRAALAALSAAPTALAASPARPADDEWSLLRSFLENATPAELMHHHLTQAAEAVAKVYPGVWSIDIGLDFGLVVLTNRTLLSRMREDAEAAS